jgi:tripartite-type tricarboxylate transporter receptor subunit TctC
VSNNHAVNPSVFKKMPYDSIADLTPITVIGGSPFVLVVNPEKVPAKNAKELQSFLKAKPGGYNYGSSGNGTIIHLAGEMYMEAAGVDVRHIPYKGMGPMLADIIGGQVEMGVGAVPAVQGHLKAGTLRAIGVMGKQRVASLPDVPTIAEQGFPSVDVEGWFALVGPAKLPAAQVKRLHDAIVVAFKDPEVKAAMAKQDNFIDPTFAHAYPAEVSPLSRANDADPFLTDRFEFFIGGREIANGFSIRTGLPASRAAIAGPVKIQPARSESFAINSFTTGSSNRA